jgi:hypothetical protein
LVTRIRSVAGGSDLTAQAALWILGGVVTVSIAVRIYLTREVHGPFVFMDELDYEQMARSFARTGHFALLGKRGLAFSPLYPIVLSPIYALTSSAQAAYEWAKVVNAALFSLSAFPIYAIARVVLSRPRALGVAALSLLAPLMFYADLELSESLAYLLFLVGIWTMIRTIRRPSAGNDLLLLGAVLLACAARLELVALLPAALTSVGLVAVARPQPPKVGRTRAVVRAVSAHRVLFGASAIALVAGLARTLANSGALPLAGGYASAGKAHASPVHVVELAFQHLAELDFALGIVPFAGALVAGYALVRFGFPRGGLVFAAVAVATTFWLVLEVAYFAAAYDGKPAIASAAQTYTTTPRIHERYLIYLVPLFLIALVAALRVARPRIGAVPHMAAAAAAALLPLAIPFSSVVNYTIVADTFGLQIFGTSVRGDLASIPQPQVLALAVGGVFALAYLYALLRPRPSFAIVMTVIAFLILSTLVRVRLMGSAQKTYDAVPAHAPWVDRAAHGSEVALVGGRGASDAALLLTAFRNLTISSVYSTCRPLFGSGFGEQRLHVGQAGVLEDAAGPVHTPYAVVPVKLGVSGRIVARSRHEGLVVVAPAGGVLRLAQGKRSLPLCDRR